MNNSFLPYSENLDVSAFSRLFSKTTTSYKILFFRTLIDNFKESGFSNRFHDLDSLKRGMLIQAWYPCIFHHLSFGVQDQLGRFLKSLGINESLGLDFDRLKLHILDLRMPKEVDALVRFVPYRLLSPFFNAELHKQKDHTINARIRFLADSCWDGESPPLYRFYNKDGSSFIEIHPKWANYLESNFAIILDWCRWAWVNYLQTFNPNAPAIVAKIDVPMHRNPLTWQTRFWRKILEGESLFCPYTGELLNAKKFQLDHFIPWSLIGHDQMWNLIPVSPSANASKGNKLPDTKYLKAVANMHFAAFKTSKALVDAQSWRRFQDDHISGLNLQDASEASSEVIIHSYEQVVFPLLQIGENSGFQSNWRWSD